MPYLAIPSSGRGNKITPIAIGDTFKTSTNHYLYVFDEGITYQIPNAHANVAVVVGDENAEITITVPSSSTAVNTYVMGYKTDETHQFVYQGHPADFPKTFTGYHTYVIVTTNNSFRYSFKVDY